MRHERASDAVTPHATIDHEAGNQDEWFDIDVVGEAGLLRRHQVGERVVLVGAAVGLLAQRVEGGAALAPEPAPGGAGVFFPAETLPSILQSVVRFLALTQVSLEGLPITGTGPKPPLPGSWVLASFAVAGVAFRFGASR